MVRAINTAPTTLTGVPAGNKKRGPKAPFSVPIKKNRLELVLHTNCKGVLLGIIDDTGSSHSSGKRGIDATIIVLLHVVVGRIDRGPLAQAVSTGNGLRRLIGTI